MSALGRILAQSDSLDIIRTAAARLLEKALILDREADHFARELAALDAAQPIACEIALVPQVAR